MISSNEEENISGYSKKPIIVDFDDESGHSVSLQKDIDDVSCSPNDYFYTRRPPGEWINVEPLTSEEVFLLMQRTTLFDKMYGTFLDLWGYIAVPFVGRTGEFLEFAYRDLIIQGEATNNHVYIDESGLIQYQIGRVITNEMEVLLKNEAFQYYKNYLPITEFVNQFLSTDYQIHMQAQAYYGEDGKLFVPNSKFRKVRMAPIFGTLNKIEDDILMPDESQQPQ